MLLLFWLGADVALASPSAEEFQSSRPVLCSRSPDPSSAGRVVGPPVGMGPGSMGDTASGELFGPDTLTAAHRTLPFGTRVV